TLATTVAWCTSNPAHRAIKSSIVSLLMRFGGACHRRLCSACSQQQYGVPQAPASDSVRTCWYHSPSRRPRTTAVAYKTFSCHGVSAAHDDSVVVFVCRVRLLGSARG